jgi:hypothetical protein
MAADPGSDRTAHCGALTNARFAVKAIRSLIAKGYARWMPHINLIYPFVPAEHISQYSLVRFCGMRCRLPH